MKKFELFAASVLALVIAMPAFAQVAPPPPTTVPPDAVTTATTDTPTDDAGNKVGGFQADDDIIVTAAKREQTLQDIPISVSVTGVDTIEKAQIVDLINLQSVVPSLRVTQFQSAGQTNFTIRGFGNGNGNIGIESSVGVFIDGVYRSRSASAIADLPDVQRIEVLRGPQSTLFGKNVSAGAISIVTKLPEFDWHVRAEATAGNYGLMQANASITGPLSETVAFRLYGNVNQRDGYFRNIVSGGEVNGRDRFSIRGDLLFQPSSDFSLRIIADLNHIDEVCCGASTLFNGPATQLIGAPRAGALGVGGTIGNPARLFDRELVYNTAPNNVLTGKGISAQADLNVGFAKLTSITAYRTQSNRTTLDVDFTGADISNQTTDDRINTFTQEFRLASDNAGPFNWLLGGFYSDERIKTGRNILFGRDARAFADAVTVPRTAAGVPILSAPFFAPPIATLENLLRLTGSTNVTPGTYFFGEGQGIFDNYTLNDRSFSIFGQFDFKITDRLTFTGGGAYLNDRKKATSDVVLTDRFAAFNVTNIPQLALAGVPPTAFAGLNAVQFFYADTANHAPVNFPNANESGILKDDKFTYAGRLAYDLDSRLNVYGSYSTGWKAGAYNLSSDSRPPNNGVGRTADPENVTVYELGAKARFSGGFLNIAVFKQSIKGFQSNAFTGTGFALVNAGKQSVKGFEVDAQYRPVRPLLLTGAVTYLDPKYDSFTRASCVSFDPVCQVPAGSPVGTLAPQFRDLSGRRPAGISKWTGSVSATYTQELGEGYSAFLRGEYDFASKTQLTDTVPANLNTFSLNTVNASLGFSTPYKLDVQLWVRNLTQDKYLLSAFQTVIQSGSFSGYPNEPRTYGVTLRKAF